MNQLNILVLFNAKHPYDRLIVNGIVEAASTSNKSIALSIMDHEEALLLAGEKKWDAVIANFEDSRIIKFCDEVSSPIVAITCSEPMHTTDQILANKYIALDSEKMASLAFEHFQGCGATHFAYFSGIAEEIGKWRDDRMAFFKSLVEKNDYTWFGDYTTRTIREFLTKPLPEKTAFFCASDTYARQLIALCKSLNLDIPENLIVIGVDDDPMENLLSLVPLTTVAIDPSDLGSAAFESIDKNQYSAVPDKNALDIYRVHPKSIVNRLSAPISESDDPMISKALTFLYNNYHRSIKAEQVTEACNCSRYVLERKFKTHLNRTIHQVIHDVRLEKAKSMLVESDKSIDEIAEQCGLSSSQYLYYLFRKEVGITPQQFRHSQKESD